MIHSRRSALPQTHPSHIQSTIIIMVTLSPMLLVQVCTTRNHDSHNLCTTNKINIITVIKVNNLGSQDIHYQGLGTCFVLPIQHRKKLPSYYASPGNHTATWSIACTLPICSLKHYSLAHQRRWYTYLLYRQLVYVTLAESGCHTYSIFAAEVLRWMCICICSLWVITGTLQ